MSKTSSPPLTYESSPLYAFLLVSHLVLPRLKYFVIFKTSGQGLEG
jgi:hypothetical protein